MVKNSARNYHSRSCFHGSCHGHFAYKTFKRHSNVRVNENGTYGVYTAVGPHKKFSLKNDPTCNFVAMKCSAYRNDLHRSR